ncbi:hypothetical protein GCM10010271_01480 [Streptomyces kurssanovii]|nr:hypothetical protein GCM10010271_01480 [Streptomyces kurssanovii]
MHEKAFELSAHGRGATGVEEGLPGGVQRHRRGVPAAVAGSGRAGGPGVQRAGGGAPFGALPPQEGGADGDQPGDGSGAEGKGEMAGDLGEPLGNEQGGRG